VKDVSNTKNLRAKRPGVNKLKNNKDSKQQILRRKQSQMQPNYRFAFLYT